MSNIEKHHFIFNLLRTKGVGRAKANKILQSIYDSKIEEFSKENLFPILEKNIDSNLISNLFLVDETQIESNKNFPKINYFSFNDLLFPNSLKKLSSNCPSIISCIGNIELLKTKKIGFCGSRNASDKGLSIAKDISQQMVKENVTIVSGYASGIDQETHYWALKEGGNTIIVIPEGINNFTIKKYIKEVWDWDKILVISEFLPEAIWSVNRAMERNLTIVGLSDIMILIEAREKGGSIDAGYKALETQKLLFAPLYEGIPEEASGNKLLLTKGAFPIMRKKETNRANLEKIINYINNLDDIKTTFFD